MFSMDIETYFFRAHGHPNQRRLPPSPVETLGWPYECGPFPVGCGCGGPESEREREEKRKMKKTERKREREGERERNTNGACRKIIQIGRSDP